MKRLPDLLAAWSVTLWVGGLWAVGYLAAPVLFYNLEDRVMAGFLAGRMFYWMAWAGMLCGAWLIAFRLSRQGGAALKQAFFWIVVGMLLLTIAQQFGIRPLMQELKDLAQPRDVMESLFRDRFETWHGISSGVYMIQSLLGLALVAKQGGR